MTRNEHELQAEIIRLSKELDAVTAFCEAVCTWLGEEPPYIPKDLYEQAIEVANGGWHGR